MEKEQLLSTSQLKKGVGAVGGPSASSRGSTRYQWFNGNHLDNQRLLTGALIMFLEVVFIP